MLGRLAGVHSKPHDLAQDNYHMKTDTDAFKKNVKSALEKRMGQGYYAQDKNSWYLTDAGDEFYRGQYETSSEQEDDEVRVAFCLVLRCGRRFSRDEAFLRVSLTVDEPISPRRSPSRARRCPSRRRRAVRQSNWRGRRMDGFRLGWNVSIGLASILFAQ